MHINKDHIVAFKTYLAFAVLCSHLTAHKHFSLSVCVATHSLRSNDQIFALPS